MHSRGIRGIGTGQCRGLAETEGNNLQAELLAGVKTKKRPRLFSPRRLGSPPPELPNYKMNRNELLILCKRHFGNGFPAAKLGFERKIRRNQEQNRQNYCCGPQVWPPSPVIQNSPAEVAILPCWGSENSMAVMSPVTAPAAEEGSTRVQCAPASPEW
jgi:hypothetical protein